MKKHLKILSVLLTACMLFAFLPAGSKNMLAVLPKTWYNNSVILHKRNAWRTY